MKITLNEIKDQAKNVKLRVGSKVAFLPMGGIWHELAWKTGVIIKTNKDPMWRYDVEIDMPHLLFPGTDHMRNNDFITCVGPTAILSLNKISKEDIPKLNNGLGLCGIDPKMSKLVQLRKIWLEILKMDQNFGEPEPIAWSTKMIQEYTLKIEKLKSKGLVEP